MDLARLQFDLRQVIISGIPMKEKDSTDPATRSMYDVELFYPSASVTAASLDYLSQGLGVHCIIKLIQFSTNIDRRSS